VVGAGRDLHVLVGVRVDDLVAEGAHHEVRLLRDEQDVLLARLDHPPAALASDGLLTVDDDVIGRGEIMPVEGPQLSDDAEEGRLAGTVGAGDHHVLPLLHLKVEVCQRISSRRICIFFSSSSSFN
jgi:hypothetical protein